MSSNFNPVTGDHSSSFTTPQASDDDDHCSKSADGKHDPDPATLYICRDGDDTYIDVNCRHCGRSGCCGKFDPATIDW